MLLATLFLSAGCGAQVWWAGPRGTRPWAWCEARQRVACWAPIDDEPGDAQTRPLLTLAEDVTLPSARRLALAETIYAAAGLADLQNQPAAADLYFSATLLSWRLLNEIGFYSPAEARGRADAIYRSSLDKLLVAAQRHGRLDGDRGLLIELPTGPLVVPIAVHSACWTAADLGPVTAVGDYGDPTITRKFQQRGIGVPVVAQRRLGRGSWFVPAGQPFALTALLRSNVTGGADASLKGRASPAAIECAAASVLEFYDPFLASSADIEGAPVPLATDTTASLVYAHQRIPYSPVRDFLRPDGDVRLTMVGPHEQGKIPVIFVHGLLSDPLTYLDLANEIRGDPRLSKRYETWAFRYPTGGAVLEAATGLRDQIAAAVAQAGCDDPALRQIVIIGHSMGGLVAKLQVTHGDATLWDRIATQPFENLRAGPEVRRRIGRAVFFEPSPAITRIVLIATPHEGSPWANRLIGRTASVCARIAPESRQGLESVLENNPGMFRPDAPTRPPTSIDLLEPSSPTLQAIRQLRYSETVTVHSIIGVGRTMIQGGPADGVVPVTSAREPAAASEAYIDAGHSELLRNQETFAEVKRILLEHLLPATR